MDAELSRARVESVDMGHMIEQVVAARDARGLPFCRRLAFGGPHRGSCVLLGVGVVLARAIEPRGALSHSPAVRILIGVFVPEPSRSASEPL